MSTGKTHERKSERPDRSHTCESPAGLPPIKIRVNWDGTDTITARTTTGCEIPMAATNGVLASGRCPSALEVFVASLGGCPAHEILEVMNEKRTVVKNIEVAIIGNRRMTPPTIFDTMHVTFTLTGDIDDTYASEVIRDVMTWRCPVAVSFGRATYLTWDHRIIPTPAH